MGVPFFLSFTVMLALRSLHSFTPPASPISAPAQPPEVTVPTHGSLKGTPGLSIVKISPTTAALVSPDMNTIEWPEPRTPKAEMGIEQLPNAKLKWMLDAKFGMFIHWGLYAGLGHGEWAMYNESIPAAKYRVLAFPESNEKYFSADHYDPKEWALLARDAGMKWMCLTTRHHDGFALFDSKHPNAFTSMQTLHRDLVAEYVKAFRKAGLKVGIYYSPLSWRYPGYFDWTGKDCKPNKLGFVTNPAHKENARVMKEENYANVHRLLTAYGKIDDIFWDGGWLGLQGTDAGAAFFHEPGRFLDPNNPWPIGARYLDREAGTKKPLGIMGMVRKYQPDAITNPRYGWMGDITEEEGGAPITGPMRTSLVYEKCLTMQSGGWGYNKEAVERRQFLTSEEIIRYLADCVVRNMVLMVNVAPDRHGVIPALCQDRLREVGQWLSRVGESVYNTRSGPWNPKDGQYGFCYRGDTLYVHILKDYAGDSFTIPPVGILNPRRAYAVYDKKPLPLALLQDRSITITGIDRAQSPADTILAIQFDSPVMAHAWRKIDDTDTRITYNGLWDVYEGNPGYGHTEHYSFAAGATAVYHFRGSAARFYGYTRKDLGKIDVLVDGVKKTTIDCYARDARYNILLYQTARLSPGSHTLVIRVNGARNPASTGNQVICDAFASCE